MALSGDGWFESYECSGDSAAASRKKGGTVGGASVTDEDASCADEDSWPRRYLMAIYWSITTMSTVGYGDLIPSSDMERAYNLIAMIFGVAFYSYIIASISSLVLQKDAKNAKYFEKMESVNLWIVCSGVGRFHSRRPSERYLL